MAIKNFRKKAYGFPNPLPSIFPDPIVSKRNPTGADKAPIGQIWVNEATASYFVLVAIVGGLATWIANGPGAVGIFSSIQLPNTDAGATVGYISFGGDDFITNYGTNNTFIGANSGNATLTVATAVNNTGIGSGVLEGLTSGHANTASGVDVLRDVTTGDFNSSYGALSSELLTTGSANSAFGYSSLDSLLTGSNNIAIGYLAGSALVAAESDNIYIGNVGVGAESNVIRIGTDGTGAGEQDLLYTAGALTSARGITATTGNIVSTAGSVTAHVTVTAATGDVISTIGDVESLVGDVVGASLFASGDTGGNALETGLTNVFDNTQGVGVMTVLSTTANPGDNAGFLKFYLGTVPIYVAYWTNIAP